MRMSDTERRELTLRLLGTADAPGPIDGAWVVRTLAGTRQTLKRWRDGGIPPDRIDDVLEAVREVLPNTTKEPPEPDWVGRLDEKVDSILANQQTIIARQGTVGQEMAGKVIEALAPLERLQAVEQLAEWLATLPPPSVEAPHDSPDTEVPGTAEPEGRVSS